MCNKCVKFGVKCEGYRDFFSIDLEEKGQGRHVFRILSRDNNTAQPPPNPLIDALAFTSPFQDPGQNRYFIYFQEQTIADLSGPFEEGLFSTIALQACYSEPSLMRLVSAIGAIHKSSRSSNKGSEAVMHQHQALLSYGQALVGIQKIINKSTLHSPRLVLIAALLIFCFENLHGDVTTATLHLQSALRLLRKQLAEKAEKYRHTAGKSPTSDIEESIIASYVRLDNGIYSCLKVKLEQAFLSSDVYGILRLNYAEDQAVPCVFVSIHEARNHLEALQFHSLPILTKEFHARMRNTSTIVADQGKTEAYLTALRGFQAWNRAFAPLYKRAMISSSDGSKNPDLMGAAIMRARGMTTILAIQTLLPVRCDPVIGALSSCLDVSHFFSLQAQESNTIFVKHHTILTLITGSSNQRGNGLVENCKEVLSITRSICADPDFRRDFVLDCGILPGLFMVIVAPVGGCINREALELMRSLVPRREGVWDSADLVTAGEAFLRGVVTIP